MQNSGPESCHRRFFGPTPTACKRLTRALAKDTSPKAGLKFGLHLDDTHLKPYPKPTLTSPRHSDHLL